MDDLGVYLALLGIFLSVLMWFLKPELITGLFSSQTVSDFIKSRNLVDKFTIAIVDDELDSYPVSYIKKLGYKVKTFESVSFSQAEELSNFDLILLDVKGVVKEDLEEGGAKLIKIIKDARSLVPIVAVSSGYFHTELNDYFKTCNDSIKKPIDEYKIREVISELKLDFYDEKNISKLIDQDIQALHIGSYKKKNLASFVIKYLKNEIEGNELRVYLHKAATTKTDAILCKVDKLKDRMKHA